MKSLFVDTTGQRMCVAYAETGNGVRKIFGTDGNSQSAEIFGVIENALGKVKVAELDFMVVLGGPGSFTGIRLGLSVAKGFNLAVKIPVVVVNNFLASFYSMDATALAEAGAEFYISIPAGVSDIYVAKYNADGVEIEAGRILKRAEFVPDLPVVEGNNIVPERVLAMVEKSFDAKKFVQAEIEPTYIKPHYAKVKVKLEI